MHINFMEEIIDLIATDASPSQISNSIKDILYTKAAERVDASRPVIASSLFGEDGDSEYTEGGE